jgi:hypothetical protein
LKGKAKYSPDKDQADLEKPAPFLYKDGMIPSRNVISLD